MHLLNQRLNQIELEIAKQQANHACIEDKIMLDPGNLDLNDEVSFLCVFILQNVS